jgi:hypothetical protein
VLIDGEGRVVLHDFGSVGRLGYGGLIAATMLGLRVIVAVTHDTE